VSHEQRGKIRAHFEALKYDRKSGARRRAMQFVFQHVNETLYHLGVNEPNNTGHADAQRPAAMLTGARPFSGPSLPFCLPVIATRSIVLSIGAESSG
jgi:hypothetical protein